MNAATFVFHSCLISIFILAALRMGKASLTGFFSLQVILANLFVLKQIPLFGFTVTATDAFALGSVLTLNLIREFYGKKEAQKAVLIALFSLIFFLFMSKVHLFYISDILDKASPHYDAILTPVPRIFFASMLVFMLVQWFDLSFYQFLRKRWPSSALPLRIGAAALVSQWIDTVLFSYLGLFGLVASLWNVIWMSFSIKCCALLLMAPFTALAKRVIKNPAGHESI